MDQLTNQLQSEVPTAELRTGECPVCGKADLPLNEDGNLPSHAPPDAKYWGSCYYTRKPATPKESSVPTEDRPRGYGFPGRHGLDR